LPCRGRHDRSAWPFEKGTLLKVVSYNLRKHAAVGELTDLVETHGIDVLCLQEGDTAALAPTVGGLRLIGATENNRLGLAMYASDERFDILDTRVFAVRKSLHDRVLRPAHERLLAARLFDKVRDREVLVGDFHAAPLTASNALRRKQIAGAHAGMRALAPGAPALMVGDFNYPWFVNKLERHLTDAGFQLTRSTEPTYVRYKYFSGYFDFVTSNGYLIERVDVLPFGASDHRPISLTAHLADD
jgi:endonuclease/exonuclease/phosphatase family metal-dependent hydrolase